MGSHPALKEAYATDRSLKVSFFASSFLFNEKRKAI